MQLSYFKGLSPSYKVFLFGGLVFFVSLSWSMYLLSISTMIMFLSILLSDSIENKLIASKTQFQHLWSAILQDHKAQLIFLYFFTVALSGLWSSELKEYWFQLRLLIPMLVVPLVWMAHSKMRPQDLIWLLRIFVLSCLTVSLFVMIRYFLHYDEYNLLLLRGKAIPTPISHIRFSLIMAMAAFLLFKSFLDKNYILNFWWDKIGFFYFFYVIHALSVKSGLLAFYLALISFILIWCYRRQLWKKALLIILSMIILVIVALSLSPSLQNKYYYTIWQIGELYRGKWLYYSDLERLKSIQAGWQMVKEHPILGTGAGDINESTKINYQKVFNHQDIRFPHNQFIFSWAYYGILNVLVLVFLMALSLFDPKAWQKEWIPALQIIVWSSMLYEHTLNTQIGIALFLFVYLIEKLSTSSENYSKNVPAI